MRKFYIKNNKIFCDKGEVPLIKLCEFLNYTEEKYIPESPNPSIKFSTWLDYTKYKCEHCHREEIGHNGLWNQEPLFFFCSSKCYTDWDTKTKAKNNELDYCPFCTENKMVYDGRADSYYCYGCHNWYEVDIIRPEYNG